SPRWHAHWWRSPPAAEKCTWLTGFPGIRPYVNQRRGWMLENPRILRAFAGAGGQELEKPVNHAQVTVAPGVAEKLERKSVKNTVNLRSNWATSAIPSLGVSLARTKTGSAAGGAAEPAGLLACRTEAARGSPLAAEDRCASGEGGLVLIVPVDVVKGPSAAWPVVGHVFPHQAKRRQIRTELTSRQSRWIYGARQPQGLQVVTECV